VKLAITEVPGAVIIKIRGKLVGGPQNCVEFRSLIKRLLNEGKKNIIINLHDTPWANSQGVGMLIGAHTSVTNAGGELVLSHVVDRIHDILTVTRLLIIFKTFGTDDEAMDYLAECEVGATSVAVL